MAQSNVLTVSKVGATAKSAGRVQAKMVQTGPKRGDGTRDCQIHLQDGVNMQYRKADVTVRLPHDAGCAILEPGQKYGKLAQSHYANSPTPYAELARLADGRLQIVGTDVAFADPFATPAAPAAPKSVCEDW